MGRYAREPRRQPTMADISPPPIAFPAHLRYLWTKVHDDPMPTTMARIMHEQLTGWPAWKGVRAKL